MDNKEMAMYGYEFGVYVGVTTAKKVLQQAVANGEGLPSAIVALEMLIEKAKTEKVNKVLADTDGAALFEQVAGE